MLSFSLSLPHLIVFHMSFVYSIVILKIVDRMKLDVSWHDRDQSIAVDNVPLVVAYSLFLLYELHTYGLWLDGVHYHYLMGQEYF